jgi:hypothetical protein
MPCDITLKHVLLSELNLWQNPTMILTNFVPGLLGKLQRGS